jgi:hypothetical protein
MLDRDIALGDGQLTREQSVSWYIGLVQAGAAMLTVVIYLMVYMRKKSKTNLNQQLMMNGFAPTR